MKANRVFKTMFILAGAVMLFGVYWSTSAGAAPHDYFKRLGEAFLQGRWYLTEHPSWLNELIPDNGRYYVVYPPMPAVLSVPFLVILGTNFQQQWLAHILGTGVAILTGLLAYRLTKSRRVLVWAFLMAGLGTINWYHAATGSVWLIGQLSAEFFLLAALVESLGKRRTFLVGLFFGMAYWSRLQIAVSLPLFLYLLGDKLWEKPSLGRLRIRWQNIIGLFVPVAIFVLADFGYNDIRFGTILDVAYIKIPGVLSESWYRYGLFSLKYIPEHLQVMFGQLPTIFSHLPYIQPSWAGLAIWITTPAFVYALRANIKERVVQFSWLAIFFVGMINLSHGSTGFAQFGYRFAMDFYPFLFFLTIKGIGKDLKWHHWLLLGAGIMVNLWGVLWINKFSWVGW